MNSGIALILVAVVIAWAWWSGTAATALAAVSGRLQAAA